VLKANSSGQWQFEALYGNLYGTTFGGGEYYSGVVYEITQ
jgi:hypothetical protein